ncbi:MAG: phage virion morphogenesis protein [Rhodocyclaceae bacterium]|nr:phage virion morphogenesis protein [Rhodocyclaceae bacterium]
MSAPLSLVVDDRTVLDALARLSAALGPAGLAPAMAEIGEELGESTQQRFSAGTAPDGTRWAPLKPGTVLARLAKISGAYAKKSGRLGAKGAGAVMGMRPLIETGMLQDGIHHQVIDGGAGVAVGTNRFAGEWAGGAAVHQFGSRDGRVPARPFLGLSAEDRTTVLEIIEAHLSGG